MVTDHLLSHLFIDIETVAGMRDYAALSPGLQEQWERKSKFIRGKDVEKSSPAQLFGDHAAVYAEFGKIICIGIGAIVHKENGPQIILKSLYDDDEKSLLNRFCEALTAFTKKHPSIILTGHNVKEFDVPYICRRMVIQGMSLPDCLQLQGKKPWQTAIADTMELWKFGDNKSYTSLALLAEVLGIPTPKDDISGADVGRVYYEEADLPRIADYCLKDVLTTARVFLKLQGIKLDPEPVFAAG